MIVDWEYSFLFFFLFNLNFFKILIGHIYIFIIIIILIYLNWHFSLSLFLLKQFFCFFNFDWQISSIFFSAGFFPVWVNTVIKMFLLEQVFLGISKFSFKKKIFYRLENNLYWDAHLEIIVSFFFFLIKTKKSVLLVVLFLILNLIIKKTQKFDKKKN